MSDVRTFAKFPPDPERDAWCLWFLEHGVDPGDVACPGWVERDEQHYRLVYEAYERDEDGKVRFDPERRDVVRVTRVFQMEGPPLPFPDLAKDRI